MIEINRVCDKCGLSFWQENITDEFSGVVFMNGFAIVQIKYICPDCVVKELQKND